MQEFTLSEIADLNSEIDKLSAPDARALHRRLRDFATAGLLRASGTRGEGEKAPAIFPLHEAAKARVMAKLMNLDMGAKTIAKVFRFPDLRAAPEPNKLRHASGLENAIEAAINGTECSVEFDLLNGGNEVRARFIYSGDAHTSDKSQELIAAHDLATGRRVVGRLSLSINELLAPLIEWTEAQSAPMPPKAN